MLILFLVCMLATLVTVHRASCYRSLQEARRRTPLRHLIPLPVDSPPAYTDTVDGAVTSLCTNSVPKPTSDTEAPPPSYEEALDREAVQMSEINRNIVQTSEPNNHEVHISQNTSERDVTSTSVMQEIFVNAEQNSSEIGSQSEPNTLNEPVEAPKSMILHQTDTFEETAAPTTEECHNLEVAVNERGYLESTTQNA